MINSPKNLKTSMIFPKKDVLIKKIVYWMQVMTQTMMDLITSLNKKAGGFSKTQID